MNRLTERDVKARRQSREPSALDALPRGAARDRPDRRSASTSASRRTSRSRTATSSTPCSSRRTTCGPTRRCGSPASNVGKVDASSATRTRTSSRSRWRSRTTACRSTRTRRSKIRPRIFLEGNFFVDLKPGTPERAEARRRRHDPGHPDLDAGPARPAADRAAVRHARRPPGAAQGLRQGARRQADGRARTPTQDPTVQGKTRRRGAERGAQRTRPTRSRAPRSSTRRCSAPSRTTSRS